MQATIRKLPPTLNERMKKHWAALHRVSKDWKLMVRAACGLPEFGKVQGKCRVTITLHRKRLQDPDNAVASVKPVLDALKHNGWLVDDSSEYLELHVREEKSKDQRTVIEWTSLTP